MNKNILVKTYRDFFLQWFDINYPLRRHWTPEQKTDFALQETWFKHDHETLLVRFAHDWRTLEALMRIVKYGVWDRLHEHPFVQEAVRLHRALFEELVAHE